MKIKFVNELPQWIISSDIAAYHPATKNNMDKKQFRLGNNTSVIARIDPLVYS